ncbi:MAG: bacteriohemerythrin [Ralstonia sp.]|uniref:Bacteriohemerythrin n=1 Tax=Ralstonia pickettii TaxID=329 RepID=A0A9Q3LN29_RALPI|nr:bacteriohemerythrin [Ralstonia pickettii]MBA9843789.1 bacteriohemerythrin [Ralstonia pickettii]MBA9849220.1 bacteriohemerythrin [Ralstonia pickettii]MBA9875862.1 bacteriohemerythrin [Ralstonia pickettii]MBA9880426.1 bacteriohemerythrin [Ralstonia pickettii]MBA9885298.1 bacteriohemerythrin [Ralstonia pickettii]
MPVIEWSEALQLGDAATDANHVEFCALLNAVADASDAEFISALDAFIDHTEHHFAEENGWMDAADFPPRHCHRGEHDNVLALCREVRKRAAAGDMDLGRRLVAELPAWFAQHVDVMDRMMTTYLVQMGNSVRNIEHVG